MEKTLNVSCYGILPDHIKRLKSTQETVGMMTVGKSMFKTSINMKKSETIEKIFFLFLWEQIFVCKKTKITINIVLHTFLGV